MRLQNLHKIATVSRSIKILNKEKHCNLNQTSLNILLTLTILPADISTSKINLLLKHWGKVLNHPDVLKYLDRFLKCKYVTKKIVAASHFNNPQFLWSITPEGLEILNQFELIVRRTRHDLGH